jgi:hypothetical protein
MRKSGHVLSGLAYLAVGLFWIGVARGESADPGIGGASISLERTQCYGDCPAYKVTIKGDGVVRFEAIDPIGDDGERHAGSFAPGYTTLIGGVHDDHVPVDEVARLLVQFRDASFWDLRDEYRAEVTDLPTYKITLTVGPRSKSVVDFYGESVGMPASVSALEKSIDRLARIDRWTSGTMELIPWLESSGFDFRSDDAAAIATVGERRYAPEALVLALIDRGAPLETEVMDESRYLGTIVPGEQAGVTMLKASMVRGHGRVFSRLASLGWLDRWDRHEAAEFFAKRGAGCSPALVDAVAAAGISVDDATPTRPTDGSSEPGSMTALAVVGSSYACKEGTNARIATAQALLERGANPNHRDAFGHTPLYHARDMAMVDLLLEHGADARIKANDGSSVIFGSRDDDIVLRLLQAGAGTSGRYPDGKSLTEAMVDHPMPRVSAWIAGQAGQNPPAR